MKVFMQYLQPSILISFLISSSIFACSPRTVSDSSQDLREQFQNQREHQQLPSKADLLKQEEVLEATALQTLEGIVQQVQQENAPNKPLFVKMHKQLKKSIKKAKKNPKVAAKLVKDTQEAQDALQTFIEQARIDGTAIVVEHLHKTLQSMVFAVIKIPEVSNARIANGGAGRPINRDNLEKLTKWYDAVIQRHFKQTTNYDTHVSQFITFVLMEEAERLQLIINANLALFQNILAQHQLK
jgi:hypothetical protein